MWLLAGWRLAGWLAGSWLAGWLAAGWLAGGSILGTCLGPHSELEPRGSTPIGIVQEWCRNCAISAYVALPKEACGVGGSEVS